MKSTVGIVVLMIGGMAGIYYASAYVMGGIEGGMPGGGNGHFSDYHDGNLVTEYLGGSSEDNGFTTAYTAGDVTAANPFAD